MGYWAAPIAACRRGPWPRIHEAAAARPRRGKGWGVSTGRGDQCRAGYGCWRRGAVLVDYGVPMADPDPTTTGLDREAYLCVFVPGVVLLVGIVAALSFIPRAGDHFVRSWERLRGLPAESVLASVVIFSVSGALALALGFGNHWLSKHLYEKLPVRRKAFGSPKLAEILPYWALEKRYQSAFYDELRGYMEDLLGDIEGLSVWQTTQDERSVRRRYGEDVAADLIDAWLRTRGTATCEPGLTEVRMWRERSNFAIALSTAIPASIVLIAMGVEARLALQHVWFVWDGLAAVGALALAGTAHRWFVFKAVSDWVNGQNLLSRLFWATCHTQAATRHPQG